MYKGEEEFESVQKRAASQICNRQLQVLLKKQLISYVREFIKKIIGGFEEKKNDKDSNRKRDKYWKINIILMRYLIRSD